MCDKYITYNKFEEHLRTLCKGFAGSVENKQTPIRNKKRRVLKERSGKGKKGSGIRKRLMRLDKEAFQVRTYKKWGKRGWGDSPEYGVCNNVRLTRSVMKNLFGFIEKNEMEGNGQMFLQRKREISSDDDDDEDDFY